MSDFVWFMAGALCSATIRLLLDIFDVRVWSAKERVDV